MKHRSGFTILEMSVIMVAFTLLLAVAAKWIHHTYRYTSKTADRREQHLRLTRLGWQLRSDVSAGETIKVNPDETLEIQSSAGEIVRYSIEGETVRRLTGQGETASQVESFGLGDQVRPVWLTEEMPDWITLAVPRAGVAANTCFDLRVRVGPRSGKASPVVADEGQAREEDRDNE